MRQLHVHVVARSEGDPGWPGPVWGYGMREPYKRSDIHRFAETDQGGAISRRPVLDFESRMTFRLFDAPAREPSQFVGFAGNRIDRQSENRSDDSVARCAGRPDGAADADAAAAGCC